MKSSHQTIWLWAASPRWRGVLVCFGAASLACLGSASATIIYSGEQNIAIPQDLNGVFINVINFQSGASLDSTWHLNPFFGGLGIANAPGFQSVRIGSGNEDSIIALALGSSIGVSSTFSFGWGGSGAEDESGHIGPGVLQFTSGQIGYLGFKLIHEETVNYGWMRVKLTANGDNGSILDWAYDSSGNSILTGAVADLGAAPLILNTGSVEQTLNANTPVTGILMDPGAKVTFNDNSEDWEFSGNITISAGGQSATLANSGSGTVILNGSISSNGGSLEFSGGSFDVQSGITGSGSLLLDGAGTLTLSGANTYSGDTTVRSGVLILNGSLAGTSDVVVETDGILKGIGRIGGSLSVSGILAPGESPGVLAVVGSSDFQSGSIFAWDLDTAQINPETNRGTAYDGVNTSSVTGSGAVFKIILTGAQDFDGVFWNQTRVWTDIFKSADGSTNIENWAAVFSGGFQYSYNGKSVAPSSFGSFALSGNTLTWSAVPEPSNLLVGLLAAGAVLRRRRQG
jgi:autotransporter-associated beta strand protein